MNKTLLMGRLTKDPETRYTQGEKPMAISKYSIAVDRRYQRSNSDGQTADFFNVVAFGSAGEFAEKYLKKGIKVIVTGHLQSGSYTNKDGIKVYTTDVVAEDQEFAESRHSDKAETQGDASEVVDTSVYDGETPFK